MRWKGQKVKCYAKLFQNAWKIYYNSYQHLLFNIFYCKCIPSTWPTRYFSYIRAQVGEITYRLMCIKFQIAIFSLEERNFQLIAKGWSKYLHIINYRKLFSLYFGHLVLPMLYSEIALLLNALIFIIYSQNLLVSIKIYVYH